MSIPDDSRSDNAAADASSVDGLVSSALPMVEILAKLYVQRGVDRERLIQVGTQVLFEAAHRYDPSRGSSFNAHASWLVRDAFDSELRSHLASKRST